jgi:hypothetical protein
VPSRFIIIGKSIRISGELTKTIWRNLRTYHIA